MGKYLYMLIADVVSFLSTAVAPVALDSLTITAHVTIRDWLHTHTHIVEPARTLITTDPVDNRSARTFPSQWWIHRTADVAHIAVDSGLCLLCGRPCVVVVVVGSHHGVLELTQRTGLHVASWLNIDVVYTWSLPTSCFVWPLPLKTAQTC